MSNELLRLFPSIDRLLARPAANRASDMFGRDRVRDILREIADEIKQAVVSGQWSVVSDQQAAGNEQQTIESFIDETESRLVVRIEQMSKPSLRRVINATGVIIHTNLGRAPLAEVAINALAEASASYSNLEYDLEAGLRGHRESHCEEVLARVTGSESAVLVNNNAAAVFLVLNTLAEGGEVIVSRGELVEIGGSFRIPEVMEKSGARLREVGTTNRTHIKDYERAIGSDTRLILRVHPSNYRIVGFTHRPDAAEIADLARRAGIPSFEDLGSGCLVDLESFGVTDEPVVAESIKAGMSVVSFSGDKMLGGPQAGVIAGSREMIERVKKNPLMRALRVDKLTYAAMEATLRLYEQGRAFSDIPVIRAISASREEIQSRASNFAEKIKQVTAGQINVSLQNSISMTGGGSAPEIGLPTVLVTIASDTMSAASIEERLRRHSTPVIARTERDRVMIDLRTVGRQEEAIILDALAALTQPATVGAAS
jgi:L-seryl-tRNA(Ser) seleniumtransferase